MVLRCLLRIGLSCALALGLAAAAYAEPARPVPLEHRAWQPVSDGEHATPRIPAAESNAYPKHRTVSHAKEATDRFHVTAVRLWLYRSFLPKSDDSDILGIETNSAWGWGKLDFSNISYIEVVDYPRAVPGMPAGNAIPEIDSATGVTDLLSAFLVSPKRKHHGPHHWAAGLAVQLPTASDPTIGTEKWSLGPAVEYEYHHGRFFAAFVALQLWSVAGADDRKDVNMLMVKPMITYELSRRWKAVYMPYGISVYWDKPSGDRVYLPIGGGIQYAFGAGRQEMAVSLQFFQYVLRPSKGAEYDLRLMVEFDF